MGSSSSFPLLDLPEEIISDEILTKMNLRQLFDTAITCKYLNTLCEKDFKLRTTKFQFLDCGFKDGSDFYLHTEGKYRLEEFIPQECNSKKELFFLKSIGNDNRIYDKLLGGLFPRYAKDPIAKWADQFNDKLRLATINNNTIIAVGDKYLYGYNNNYDRNMLIEINSPIIFLSPRHYGFLALNQNGEMFKIYDDLTIHLISKNIKKIINWNEDMFLYLTHDGSIFIFGNKIKRFLATKVKDMSLHKILYYITYDGKIHCGPLSSTKIFCQEEFAILKAKCFIAPTMILLENNEIYHINIPK